MYSTGYCPYCHRAKDILKSLNLSFDEIAVDRDPALREEMMQRSGRRTVPQIFVGEEHLGGCDDLKAAQKSGELDAILERNGITAAS